MKVASLVDAREKSLKMGSMNDHVGKCGVQAVQFYGAVNSLLCYKLALDGGTALYASLMWCSLDARSK